MHPVEAIVVAFARQEGWGLAGKVPTLRRNPIDLMYAGQMGATGMPGTIATFSRPELGITAAFRQVWLWTAEGKTLRQMIYEQAPPEQNDTATYLANVLQWTGLPPDTPMLDLLPPLASA